MKVKFCALLFLFVPWFSFAQSRINKEKKHKSKKEETFTRNGYRFRIFPVSGSDKIQVGDLVYFEMQVMHEDSVIEDSRRHIMRPEVIIPESEEESSKSPVIDGLLEMQSGDSIIVFEKLDTISELPPEMMGWKEINYRIKVNEVVKKELLDRVRCRKAAIEDTIKKDLEVFKNQNFSKIIQTQSGLMILMHREAEGDRLQPGEVAKIQFYAVQTKDGKYFDSTFDSGVPFKFVVGSERIIEGLGEAVTLLRRGEAATVFIPSKLAYGSSGLFEKIDPNTDLTFYIEVLNN